MWNSSAHAQPNAARPRHSYSWSRYSRDAPRSSTHQTPKYCYHADNDSNFPWPPKNRWHCENDWSRRWKFLSISSIIHFMWPAAACSRFISFALTSICNVLRWVRRLVRSAHRRRCGLRRKAIRPPSNAAKSDNWYRPTAPRCRWLSSAHCCVGFWVVFSSAPTLRLDGKKCNIYFCSFLSEIVFVNNNILVLCAICR